MQSQRSPFSSQERPSDRNLFLRLHIRSPQTADQFFIRFFLRVLCRPVRKRHHIFSVVLFIIASGKTVPVKQTQKFPPVSLIHPVLFLSVFQITVYIFSIDAYHPGRVFGPFHASFDLQRIHSRFGDPGNQIQRTDVFGTEERLPCFSGNRISVVQSLIGQAAWLGAAPPVPAPASQNAAEETLARITVAKRAMHKGFQFHARLLMNPGNLRKGQFPGQHRAADPGLLKQTDASRTAQIHLCAGVHRKVRKPFSYGGKHTHILNQHRVHAPLIAGPQVLV